MGTAPLSDAQIERYSRQIILPSIGGRGQQRLLGSTVGLIGRGPLAATVGLYLTAAGIGRLELWSELDGAGPSAPNDQAPERHRRGTGEAWSDACSVVGIEGPAPFLDALNSDTQVEMRAFAGFAASTTQVAVFVCADVPVAVLRTVNERGVRTGVPLVVGAGTDIALYAGHDVNAPCAACDTNPPHGPGSAALEAASGVVGSLLALAAIKLCLALPDVGIGRALHYEPETLTITECPIAKRAPCACAAAVADA